MSSYEFGDAYLAQGWARDFIIEVLDKFTAVFIGYSADDPPIRYLLEGLQERKGIVSDKKIYAFQSADSEAVAQWKEKGVQPIVYDIEEDMTHNLLWQTLDAWGKRSQNPRKWTHTILSKATKGPVKLKSHERGMVAHIVQSRAGANAFSSHSPVLPAEWLCVFDRFIRLQQAQRDRFSPIDEDKLINPYQLYKLDNDPPASDRNETYSNKNAFNGWDAFVPNRVDYDEINSCYTSLEESKNPPFLSSIKGIFASQPPMTSSRLDSIMNWIAEVCNEPIAVWWAGRQGGLHPKFLKRVQYHLYRNKREQVSEFILKQWNRVFELNRYINKREDFPEYNLKDRINITGWDDAAVREFGRVSSPYLKSGSFNSCSIPRGSVKKLEKYQLVELEVGYPSHLSEIDIPDNFLSKVVATLRKNIELAIDMEESLIGWLDDVESFSPDDQEKKHTHVNRDNLSGYIRYFAELYARLYAHDLQGAQEEFYSWKTSNEIFLRLRIWASSFSGLLTNDEFTNQVSTLPVENFWSYKWERDLLIALRNRWNDLEDKNKKTLEEKILENPPRFYGEEKKEYKKRSAHNQLNRFHWLKSQNCVFVSGLDKIKEMLLKKAPDWKDEYALPTAQSLRIRSGWVRTDTNCENLKNLPISMVTEEAEKETKREWGKFVEHDPFLGLCNEAPLKAISALHRDTKRRKCKTRFWKSFLNSDSRKMDPYRMKLLISGRLLLLPNQNFKEIMLTVSRWFEVSGEELREKNMPMFEKVWAKFIENLKDNEEGSFTGHIRQEGKDINWADEAINSVSGNLSELHMTDPVKNNLETGRGFPKRWIEGVRQLLSLPGDSRRYVIVIFTYNLNWFHLIDPSWTNEHFIKMIEDDDYPNLDKDAFWSGLMWGATTPNAELYLKLKPFLLKMADERSIKGRVHNEVLSGVLLAGWGSKDNQQQRYVSDQELREVLLRSSEDFRLHLLYILDTWVKREEKWRQQVIYFLRNVWPKHKKVRTSKISARLAELAFAQKEQFPEVCKVVVQLVSKVTNEHIYIPEIRKLAKEKLNDEDVVAESFVAKYSANYLELLYVILPERAEKWPYGIDAFLKKLEQLSPVLKKDYRFIELEAKLNMYI